MKKKTILIIFLLCSASYGATRTSVGSGNWSAAGTWDTGVPVDGDAFVIAAGHTVTFDVDQSAMATGMIASSIASTGKLQCSTSTGTYILKMGGDLTLDGTLQAGTDTSTPLPSDVTFTIDFNTTAFSIVGSSTGRIYFYAQHPTNKWIQLSANEASGQTILSVDTDVTGDSMWAAGNTVTIGDYTTGVDKQETTISSTAASTITVNDALDSDNVQNAYIALIYRNISIIDTTDYALKTIYDSWIECEFRDTDGFSSCYDNTLSYCTFSNNAFALRSCINITIADCVFTNPSGSDQIFSSDNIDIANSLFAGGYYACRTVDSLEMDNCTIAGGGSQLRETNGTKLFSCNFLVGTHCIYQGVNHLLGSCVFDDSTNVMSYCVGVAAYNCDFSNATTEFNGYDNRAISKVTYASSEDHDQTANAFKAWCRGGIVTSQTASPPTGYDIWYEFTAEDTTQTYSVFRQFETTVQAGQSIEVDGKIRIADGEDMTGYAPELQIIDKFADPLVDSSASVLDSDAPGTVDGTDTGWQDVDVIWANTGDSPRTVYVRMEIQHDGGGDDVIIDGVWDVADYKDQINTILSVVRPLDTTVSAADTATSFTLTAGEATADAYNNMALQVQDADDDHWEERTISDWTAGRVITVDTAFSFTPAVDDVARIVGTAYGASVDSDAIADAVWDEAVADHTTETSFGGEVGGLDPNLTLVLADTNELQTDWTDGGRLDVILDAIKYKTDLISLVDTTVKDVNDANNFTIEDGTDVNDAYWYMAVQVEDADGNNSKEIRWVDGYDENSGDPNVWVDEPFSFTPAVGDVVHIMGTCYGGYLFDIQHRLEQARSIRNFIDGTSGSTTTRSRQYIYKEEDDGLGLIPGI